jgi:DNA-binding transcriptional LysR family regulator
MPDTCALQSALLVREHASFRRASEALGVNQSVLSRRILALEDSLGVSLFRRHPTGARPTDAGEEFLDRAERALTLLQEAAAQAGAAGRGEVGQLRLGHVWPVSGGGGGRLLGAYRQGAADVDIHLREASATDLVAALITRAIDLAFIEEEDAHPDLERFMFHAEPWRLATPAHADDSDGGWPQDRPMLCVAADEQRVRRMVAERHGPEASVSPQFTSYDGLMSLVAASVGCAMAPQSVAAPSWAEVRFGPLPVRPATLRLAATWRSDNANPALRRFVSLMRVQAIGYEAGAPPRLVTGRDP